MPRKKVGRPKFIFSEIAAIFFIVFVAVVFGFHLGFKASKPRELTPGLEHPSIRRGVSVIYSKVNRDLASGQVKSVTLFKAPLRNVNQREVMTEIVVSEDDCSYAHGFFSSLRRYYVHLWGPGGVAEGCSQQSLILRVKDLEAGSIVSLPHKPQKKFSFNRVLWSRDGKSFFFNWENMIQQFQVVSGELLTIVEGAGPMGFVGYTGDGSKLYFSDREAENDAFYEYDTHTGLKRFLFRIPKTAYDGGYWLSPNEQLILIPYRVRGEEGRERSAGLKVFNIRLGTLWTVVEENPYEKLLLPETGVWYTLPPPRVSFVRTEPPPGTTPYKDTQIVLTEVEEPEKQTILISSQKVTYRSHFWGEDGLVLAVRRSKPQEELQLCFLLMEFNELRDRDLCIEDREVNFVDYDYPQIKIGATLLDAFNLFQPVQRILQSAY